jgi:hypothetical protein
VARALPIRAERFGRVVAQTKTGVHGNFHLNLAAGRYTFEALYAFSPHRPCGTRRVTVNRRLFVFLTCSIK